MKTENKSNVFHIEMSFLENDRNGSGKVSYDILFRSEGEQKRNL